MPDLKRVCFQLQVKPQLIDEYRERHSPVPEGMLREIAAAGRRNYSLFLRDDGLLIGYYETADQAAGDAYLAASEVATAWEADAAKYFEALDGRPDQSFLQLAEVFNLEDQLGQAQSVK